MPMERSPPVLESEVDVRIDDLLAEQATLGLVITSNDTQEDIISDHVTEISDPPLPVLAPYAPFVQWLLSAPIEQIVHLHKTLPFELTGPFALPEHDEEESSPSVAFESKGVAEYARAAAEAECEAVADLLSVATRERDGISEKVMDLQAEREQSRERISLLESRIVKHLQDRDLAIAEKYTTEKQIAEIEQWKAQHPEKRQSMLMGFLKKPEKRTSVITYTNKDIERLQKDIADTKVETALAKAELDTHYYRLRQLEKKCVELKLEIAQASALEDDLQASLAQLRRERRTSLDKLQQVSDFSIASQKQPSPRGKKMSWSPRRGTVKM